MWQNKLPKGNQQNNTQLFKEYDTTIDYFGSKCEIFCVWPKTRGLSWGINEAPRVYGFDLNSSWQADKDHYDNQKINGLTFPRTIRQSAFTQRLDIEGCHPLSLPVAALMYQQGNNHWLRKLAHGRELYLIPAGDIAAVVFTTGLLTQLRSRGVDLDRVSNYRARQDGKVLDKTTNTNMQPNKLPKSFRAGFLLGPRMQNRNMRSHGSAINWHSSASNGVERIWNFRTHHDPTRQVQVPRPPQSPGPCCKALTIQALRPSIPVVFSRSPPRPINGYWITCPALWPFVPLQNGSKIFLSLTPNALS